MQKHQQLNEGLRAEDLKDLVHPIFEVDTYRSKMGEDRDVCVVSFQVRDRSPANDLMEFIEKGYHFVLDADISSGENENGEYSVFVELNRSPQLAEEIRELMYGVKKVTGIKEFKFKYHKEGTLREVNDENLKSAIPLTPGEYDGLLVKAKTESIKHFFNKTLMDDLTLDGDVITIHKPFNQSIKLKMVREDSLESILETTQSTITVDVKSTAEIFWLTKVLGNYNINKIGDNFILDNNGQAMLLQRI
jgi:hypothetical protein